MESSTTNHPRDDGTGHEAAEGLETENRALKKRLAEQVFGDDLFPAPSKKPALCGLF